MASDFPGRIIYVPGKDPKPDPMLHRALLWRALQTGLSAAQPACAAALDGESFSLAAWNQLYYPDLPPSTPNFEAIERLLAGGWDARKDQREAESWHVKVQLAIRNLADRFPFLLKAFADEKVRSIISETDRYFDKRESIGREIREVLKAPLRRWLAEGRPVLVLGHSLGSVIAWDAMWELTHEEHVTGKLEFVSMGSPLGIRFVQQRLRGRDRTGTDRYPYLVARWHNIAAIGDLISLDPRLSRDFREMRELNLVDEITDYFQGIYTHYRDDDVGLNPHRSYGYLIHPVVAARVAAWWWQSR